ncbi:hypothetical protein RN001_004284 [Aquatica leii]|uniref:Uncharacterized protein n=1 Tax=Aquatica leii TaxID=1421715 RepID=A0AAN7SRM5_9COLE|nr:hypothetical protein RN001_004284 [Aquatica leii]
MQIGVTVQSIPQSMKDRMRSIYVPDNIRILKYPCHSQAVEQNVKLVTKASAAVCDNEARDGFIRSRITSRDALPKFYTKNEYFKVL